MERTRIGRRRSANVTAAVFLIGRALAGTLTVHFIDVGQGDSIFLQTPRGRYILIDGGANGFTEPYDAGYDLVLPYLQARGVTRLDYVVASHAHEDHIGGLLSVMKALRIRTLYDSGYAYQSQIYRDLVELVSERKAKYERVRRNDQLDWKDPEVEVFVLNPPDELWDDPNNNSLVLQVAHGRNVFLFTGDAEEIAEESMVAEFGDVLRSDVLKVGHHGSRTSSTDRFIRHVKPRIAVISCGRNNRFGHPHADSLEVLRKFGVKVYRTDRQGSIRVKSDGKTPPQVEFDGVARGS